MCTASRPTTRIARVATTLRRPSAASWPVSTTASYKSSSSTTASSCSRDLQQTTSESQVEMASAAAEVVTRFISLVGGSNPEDMAACWDENNAVLEVPYAPPPWPTKIEGKDNVVGYMGGVHTVISGWSMGIDTLYDAGDGNIIVEMHGSGTVVATGKHYAQ